MCYLKYWMFFVLDRLCAKVVVWVTHHMVHARVRIWYREGKPKGCSPVLSIDRRKKFCGLKHIYSRLA